MGKLSLVMVSFLVIVLSSSRVFAVTPAYDVTDHKIRILQLLGNIDLGGFNLTKVGYLCFTDGSCFNLTAGNITFYNNTYVNNYTTINNITNITNVDETVLNPIWTNNSGTVFLNSSYPQVLNLTDLNVSKNITMTNDEGCIFGKDGLSHICMDEADGLHVGYHPIGELATHTVYTGGAIQELIVGFEKGMWNSNGLNITGNLNASNSVNTPTLNVTNINNNTANITITGNLNFSNNNTYWIYDPTGIRTERIQSSQENKILISNGAATLKFEINIPLSGTSYFAPQSAGTDLGYSGGGVWNNSFINYSWVNQENATTICLGGDCKTAWPAAGSDNTSWNETYANGLYVKNNTLAHYNITADTVTATAGNFTTTYTNAISNLSGGTGLININNQTFHNIDCVVSAEIFPQPVGDCKSGSIYGFSWFNGSWSNFSDVRTTNLFPANGTSIRTWGLYPAVDNQYDLGYVGGRYRAGYFASITSTTGTFTNVNISDLTATTSRATNIWASKVNASSMINATDFYDDGARITRNITCGTGASCVLSADNNLTISASSSSKDTNVTIIPMLTVNLPNQVAGNSTHLALTNFGTALHGIGMSVEVNMTGFTTVELFGQGTRAGGQSGLLIIQLYDWGTNTTIANVTMNSASLAAFSNTSVVSLTGYHRFELMARETVSADDPILDGISIALRQ